MARSRKRRLEQYTCLERGEDIKGFLICNCKCVGGCIPKGRLLGLSWAPVSLWSSLTCMNSLQTPDTSPGKLRHPSATPGLLWPLLGSPVHSPSPSSPHTLLQASVRPRLLPDALPALCVPSSVSSRLCPFCTSG